MAEVARVLPASGTNSSIAIASSMRTCKPGARELSDQLLPELGRVQEVVGQPGWCDLVVAEYALLVFTSSEELDASRFAASEQIGTPILLGRMDSACDQLLKRS